MKSFGSVMNRAGNVVNSGLNHSGNPVSQSSNQQLSESSEILYDAKHNYIKSEDANVQMVMGAARVPNNYAVINRQETTFATEDSGKWDRNIIDQMNWYNYSGGVALNSFDNYEEGENNKKNIEAGKEGLPLEYFRQADMEPVVHSLFSPYFGINQRVGIVDDVPYAAQADWSNNKNDWGDCSISTLVRLSRQKRGLLGQNRYKYADFMFCKELGLPNNRLITLRRFSSPCGDTVGSIQSTDTTVSVASYKPAKSKSPEYTGKKKKVKQYNNNSHLTPIGVMCCYFDGNDNKLESILKYSFKSTYKEMNSKIERQDSQEDASQSIMGSFVNSMSGNYAQHVINGTAGTNNLFGLIGGYMSGKGGLFGMMGRAMAKPGFYHGNGALYKVDANKIYEPKNTIQSVDYYEGKLQFTHEFTLTFSYVMRAYDNINTKSAFLDLLHNILRVTYNTGKFWGGARQLNGPQPNPSGWNKANAFIDKTWDKLGSGIVNFLQGGFDMQSILGALGNLVNGAIDVAKKIVSGVQQNGVGGTILSAFQSVNDKYHITDQMKAKLKDSLGRPAIYAWDSLLSGDNTGMWHVTIGNPLRPIASFGNLEVTNTEIQHCGALGIDDFPTELKVIVSLKHARPRDATDIGKMYTKGASALLKPHIRSNPSKIYKIYDTFDQAENTRRQEIIEEQNKIDEQMYKAMAVTRLQPTTQAPTTASKTKDSNNDNKSAQPTTASKTKDDNNNKDNKDKKDKKDNNNSSDNKGTKTNNNSNSTKSNKTKSSDGSTTTQAPATTPQPDGPLSTWTTILDDTFSDKSHVQSLTQTVKNAVFEDYIGGLEYIGEFDWNRMKANMDELA